MKLSHIRDATKFENYHMARRRSPQATIALARILAGVPFTHPMHSST